MNSVASQKMEVDFDKEIDAMLRNARTEQPAVPAAGHLDVDQIAAFAENALPEKSRAMYMSHLADCDRCRKILSNVAVMNLEAAPVAASLSAITIAERAPWYRRLFLFPNLAYVMGTLVLIFGGFLAVSVIQNSRNGDGAIVSQVADSEPRQSGPNFQVELPATSAANSTAANAASNSALSVANANTATRSEKDVASGPSAGENATIDGLTAAERDKVSPPPPPPAGVAAGAQPAPKDDRDDLKEKAENKVAAAPMQDAAKSEALSKQQYNLPAQSGPMRSNENQYNRQLENLDRRAAKRSAARDEESSARRVVGGRTFERKEGVWYDTGYQGRPTINVRRGTAEYNRLDAGLKSIADSLQGTIVVVWGAKAYRIQ